jgi:hypothetical protein
MILHFFAATTLAAQPADSTLQAIKAKDILTGNTPSAQLYTVRKYGFIQNAVNILSSTHDDTSLTFQLQNKPKVSLYLTPEELHQITPVGPDPFGPEIQRRLSDTPRTLSLNRLLQGIAETFATSSPKFSDGTLPIPTNLEIDILKVLWENRVASHSDIYAQIDTSWKITSKDLEAILEDMANRGFLDRKKISPSHEFSLFGLAAIEVSALNRKNQVHLYWSLAPKDKLITYLDAKRYLAYSHASNSASNGVGVAFYKLLEEKLYRLVQENQSQP